MRYRALFTFLMVFTAACQVNAETKDYQQLLESAEEQTPKIEKPMISNDMLKKILNLQKRVEELQQQSKPEEFNLSVNREKSKSPESNLEPGSKSIWLMISSSMPETTIKNYLADIDRFGLPIKVVIRGLIEADIKNTLAWTQKLMKKQDCKELKKCSWYKAVIAIDPLPFRFFQIKEVPALGIADTLKVASEEKATKADLNSVILGDASIMALLEKAGSYHLEAGTAFKKMKGN